MTVLTVAVPTLNSGKTLNWTLASLTALKRIRIVVVDSFSTDDTLDICRRWSVETISVPAGNLYAAVNAGLRTADTDWLAYVNSDDWIFGIPYGRLLDKALDSPADVVYGSADYVDESGRFLFSSRPAGGALAARILRGGYMAFCQPAVIFRKTAYDALHGFDERYRAAADYDFFFRAALAKMSFSRLEYQPVAAFRLHQNQLSVRKPELDRSERTEMNDRRPRGLGGRFAMGLWQASNLPWYLCRMLRTYGLSGQLVLYRSHEPQPGSGE